MSSSTSSRVDRRATPAKLGPAPVGPDLVGGRDEQLYPRLGADHRADVPPVEHRPACAGGEGALEVDQRRAHLGDRRDLRRGLGDLFAAKAVALEILGAEGAGGRHGLLARKHPPAHGAVEKPGVEMGETEMTGDRPGDGALAARGRAVDGDGEAHRKASLCPGAVGRPSEMAEQSPISEVKI